ncbi:uncharacterized protein [Rutidosis leptorrhynchoides]|uniref:uncharacterized protein n=1 Tax=Rutidosis leptorrhynchoides TaxID=125765 RepID=UPI003A9946BA
MFPRLYKLENSKNCCIKDRVSRGSSGFVTYWNWVRAPSGRTEAELDRLCSLLSSFSFSSSMDKWSWSLTNNGLFTVKKLSSLIDSQLISPFCLTHGTAQNKLVPKKVEIFVWRAQKKRLPVKLELDKRGIDLNSVRCSLCDEDIESVEHSLFSCKQVMDVCSRVLKWWGLNDNYLSNMADIINDGGPSSSTCNGRGVWQAVKWITLYLIWKNRNKKVFQGNSWNPPMALNEIQSLSFKWISTRAKKKINIDWLTWLASPCIYLNS